MKFIEQLKQFWNNLKEKIRMNIFNLFDLYYEQFARWYYFEIDIKTQDGKNEYLLPIICCMRELNHAEDLKNQIQRDLLLHFNVGATSVTQLSKIQKEAKITQLENDFKGIEAEILQTLIYRIGSEHNRNILNNLPFKVDLNVGNFEIGVDYHLEKSIPFQMKIIKNQGVPFNQIRNLFVVKLDKTKLS